jgi:hypothetical protein
LPASVATNAADRNWLAGPGVDPGPDHRSDPDPGRGLAGLRGLPGVLEDVFCEVAAEGPSADEATEVERCLVECPVVPVLR